MSKNQKSHMRKRNRHVMYGIDRSDNGFFSHPILLVYSIVFFFVVFLLLLPIFFVFLLQNNIDSNVRKRSQVENNTGSHANKSFSIFLHVINV